MELEISHSHSNQHGNDCRRDYFVRNIYGSLPYAPSCSPRCRVPLDAHLGQGNQKSTDTETTTVRRDRQYQSPK